MMESTLAKRVDRRPKRGMGTVVAVGLALVVGSILLESGSAFRDREQDKAERQVLASELTTALSEAYQGRQVEVGPSVSGEAGELGRLMKVHMNALVADQQASQAEFVAAGGDRLLDASTFAGEAGLSGARARLAKARAITEKYRVLPAVRLAELRAAVQASPRLSPTTKREALAGVDKGQARALAKVERIWGLEAKILDEVEGGLDVLQGARGRWVVRDGQLLFARDDDLKAYDAHVQKIRRLAAEEEALVAGAQAETMAGVERLRNPNGG
ncbi:hypothetical protein [Caulobacter sp. 17J65-9]|uniref:hypothetical protein n=1 Tax=Caulobacter sp. 17J65-9 TaxID=2709382 RepID=UPI0013CC5938|nr:hypothetical protein [Caulobacter sp. 17J65-9]NEX95201.1 hypothetical protein [Caulobacter sp. 17J65-9]